MRTKLVTLAAVGALAVGGATVAGTAIAATGNPSPAPTPGRSSAAPGAGDRSEALSARQQRIKEALAGLVADKTLTQEQADKVAERLAASGPPLGKRFGGPFGRGHGPKAGLSAAATALGLTEADLRAQLRAGKSLATVAKEKGVAVEKVVDALVTEAQQRLKDAVTAGRLTQAQADERLKDLRARVTERVNATPPARSGRGEAPAPLQPRA